MTVRPRKASVHLETLAGNGPKDNNIMKIMDKDVQVKYLVTNLKYQNNKEQT
ncbi:11292_t:CDS:1, partial [Racocetra persica]